MTEVLVTVVILSIGLLGIAGLQATALRNNHSAYLRTQATLLSYDIADRMRANMVAVGSGSYNIPNATSVASCSTEAGCSTDQMAQNDAWQWRQSIALLLPQGVGTVCLDSSPNDGNGVAAPACSGNGSIYVIKIWWDDDHSGNLKRFVMSFQP